MTPLYDSDMPIDKAPTVTVYLWEYARLIASAAKLNLIEDMTNKLDNYELKKFLGVMFSKDANLQD